MTKQKPRVPTLAELLEGAAPKMSCTHPDFWTEDRKLKHSERIRVAMNKPETVARCRASQRARFARQRRKGKQ